MLASHFTKLKISTNDKWEKVGWKSRRPFMFECSLIPKLQSCWLSAGKKEQQAMRAHKQKNAGILNFSSIWPTRPMQHNNKQKNGMQDLKQMSFKLSQTNVFNTSLPPTSDICPMHWAHKQAVSLSPWQVKTTLLDVTKAPICHSQLQDGMMKLFHLLLLCSVSCF